MAKKGILYSEIKWEAIDYTKVTKVVDICRTIKEHYWNCRPCGSSRSEIIANGLDYDFLIKAFSTYHEDWYKRTSNSSKIAFFVEIPKEYGNDENCKSFHLILDGEIPSDSSISHKFTKAGRLRQDVLICCREAIKPIKDQLKIDSIGSLCPYKQIALTRDNIDIHHDVVKFSIIADNWINENGGVDTLHKYVSPSINGGTITKFTNEEIKQSFVEYHNRHAHLIAISKEAHREIHSKK